MGAWKLILGIVDDELVAKIESELQMEKEMRDHNELPASIKDYLENSPFKARLLIYRIELMLTIIQIRDLAGQEEVELSRQFGNESIKVVFSIADLNTLDSDPDRFDDPSLYDEEDAGVEDGQSSGTQSKSTAGVSRTRGGNTNVSSEAKVAPTDRPEPADEEEASSLSEDQNPSFPARVNVIVDKAGRGALQIETVVQDGMVVIDNVYYFPLAELADVKNAEGDWQRRGMYTGPPFGNLDEDLQVLLERYLDERGVNTALALFIPDYIDYKEQKEYISWLSNVKKFVEA
ncbi:MAG: hypothetical protein M1840_001327 [Geoglossum simile]|nr:MAG: hypothetical protein M1840_001327 [Geoglossum simile]